MKKVLFLIHTLGAGGAEKVLVNLVNNLDRKKYDITVMTVIDTGIYRDELISDIKYKTMFRIPSFLNRKKEKNNESGSLLNKTSKKKKLFAKIYSFFWRWAPVRLIYKWKIRTKYDVEVAFLEGISSKIISASNQKSKKYSWIHVDLLNEKKSENVFRNRKSEKKCYQKFDKIVTVSNTVKEQFVKKFDYNEKDVIVKYNVINDEEIISKSFEKVEKLKDNDGLKIVTIGRLSKQKGYDRLLEVALKLKQDNLKFSISIIGIGPKEDELKEFVKNNDLSDYVNFLGFKKNPYPYLKQADLFVCSSRSEGFSTVASEATILGIPIVSTECSGMHELLGENEYGIITKNDTESLYIGLKDIICDQKKYKYYSEKIKLRKEFFSLENSVKNVESLLGD